MRRNCFLCAALVAVLLVVCHAAAQSASKAAQTAGWKTFASRAGWTVRYPRGWRVSSCRACDDPSDPDVYVTFEGRSAQALIMIEPLSSKPPDKSIDEWLIEVATATVLNPRVQHAWVVVDHQRALKVLSRNPDSTKSESIYVVRGSKTLAIRGADLGSPYYPTYQQMLATFKFTTQ
jgi:hypothetical protein